MTNVVALPAADWTNDLMRNRKGDPLGNLHNVLHALRTAPEWQGVLALDEFAMKVMAVRPPPWTAAPVEEWADEHDSRMCEWLQAQDIPAAIGTVARAVAVVAQENRVHPVRDYLHGLQWDGTPRLDTWLSRYLGVEDSPYSQAVGSRFLTSAVARLEEPGCKVDHVLILEGAQGTLKSQALEAIGSQWFSDRLSRFGSKDAAMEVAGVWIVEIAELDALFKSTNSATKSFISRQQDRFRPPYGRHLVNRPRQCVFAGTINPLGGYLNDPTGARRFWPVKCGVINLDALRRDRDQLLAEALVRYRSGAPWHLETPELEALAKAEQELRYWVHPWTETVHGWLIGHNDVSTSEVLTGALGIAADSQTHSHEIQIAKILVREGFEQYRPGSRPRTPRWRREVVNLGAFTFARNLHEKP